MIRFLDGIMVRLGKFPTTQGRVVFTLVCVFATMIRYLVFGVPYRMTAQAIPVMDGWTAWLTFLAVLSGADVAAVGVKRFSDIGYTTAKNANAPSPVTVEAPATVNVETQGTDAKTTVEPAPGVSVAPPAQSPRVTGQAVRRPLVRRDD